MLNVLIVVTPKIKTNKQNAVVIAVALATANL